MYFKPIKFAVNSDEKSGSVVACSPILFTWGAEHSETDAYQSAYRIVMKGDKGSLFDSGWVETDKMMAVCALSLRDNERVSCALELRDNLGSLSECAYNEFFSPIVSGWRARWITTPFDKESEPKYFRKRFTVNKAVKSAYLHVCGIGYHSVEINGKEADGAHLQPAHSNYKKNCYYVSLPIKDLLKNGENDIEVTIADGWRRNFGSYLNHAEHEIDFFGIPMLTAELNIEYESGDTHSILTDESWSCGRGEIFYSHLFFGERLDERIERDYSENAIFVSPAPTPVMKPQTIRPIRANERLKPKARIKVGGGYVFDFGTNIAGIGEITIPGGTPLGQTIRVHYAEDINPDGSVNKETLRTAESVDEFISDGRSEDRVRKTKFVYHGFRYIFVEGWYGVPSNDLFTAVEMYTDVKNESFFKCSSPVVNAIHECVVRTEKNNLHSIATDCPQRDERMGWLNDATVRFEETPYNFNTGRLFSKIMDDITAEQDERGAISCTAPFVYGYRPADPVSSSYLIAALENYIHRSDASDIKRHYESFKAWNDCLRANSEDGIVNYGYYGDWAGPADYCIDEPDAALSRVTPRELMSTGYHFFNYKLLERFAKILGDESEAKLNAAEAERVKAAFLKRWWNAETATVHTGEAGHQAFALWLGILPAEDALRAARKMHDAVDMVGYRLTTGNLTTRYLIDTLFEYGYADDAWKLLTREKYPSWGYMIANGATSIWERFEFKRGSSMNSGDHPMYAAVGYDLYHYLVGLRPGDDGWQSFVVKPALPTECIFAEAKVDTPFGEVYAKWQKQLGKIDLIVCVPFGARATVYLPWGEIRTVGCGTHDFHRNE